MNTARETALDLAANYGIPVFPCKPDKSPATPRGFYDATTDLEQIDAWFKDDTLIGIPTGEPSGIVVADIDPAGLEWYSANAHKLACGCVNRTRRNGFHLVFKRTRPVACSASKVAPGVDIRGDGGYIVYWPGAGLVQTGGLDELTPFPDWLVPESKGKPLADTALLPGVYGQGGRNEALSRASYKMRKNGMNLPEILAALRVTNQQRCVPPLPDEEVVKIVQGKLGIASETPAPVEPGSKIILRPLHEIVDEQRESEWLLHKILEANVLAVLAGPRGTFKSFIALDWAMRCAAAGHGVVMLSGEGAGLDRRADAWRRTHKPDLDLVGFPFVAVERPLNLRHDLGDLAAAIGTLAQTPALVVVDTFSKFSAGIDENDNGEVSAFLSALVEYVRDAFRCTVLMVAHSGHADAKRPRGASALMANPDAEYIVDRPPGMVVTVTRERFKDSAALPPLAYEAKPVDLGRLDAYGELVTSLALIGSEPPMKTLKEPPGSGQRKILNGLRVQQKDAGERLFWSVAELRKVGRMVGLSKSTARYAVEGLAMSQFLVPVAGGGYGLPVEEIDNE